MQHISTQISTVVRRAIITAACALCIVAISPMAAHAGDYPIGEGDGAPPINTFVPIRSPRPHPLPIPHTSVHDPSVTQNYIQGGGLRPQNREAAAQAAAQGTAGKPGVLQTVTEHSTGITLFQVEETVCANFNPRGQWERENWTEYFAGWGPYAADDGYYQAKNVTFSREMVIGPGSNYANAQAAMKISSHQPYEAGIMSPAIDVRPGERVRVKAYYLIYNHDTPGRTWDYVSMGIIPKLGERASYVNGYQRGEWAVLEQEIVAEGDQIVIMLQGHSPDAVNSNIYFDNVSLWVNDSARGNCRN